MKEVLLVFSANTYKWGAERSVTSMCVALKERGIEVLVIIPRKGPITELLDDSNIDYIEHDYPLAITHFDSKVPKWRRIVRKRHLVTEYFKTKVQLSSLEDRLKNMGVYPIGVYSASLTANFGVKYAKKMGIIHIQHIRENLDAFNYRFKWGNQRGINLIRNNSKLIIATCNAIKDRYERDFYPLDIVVVNNGVEPVNLLYNGNKDRKLSLIQTTRLMSDKNVIDTLRAISIVVKTGRIDIKLDIYGNGEQEPYLKKIVEDNKLGNYVCFKGFVEDIDYQGYDIGLMTSLYEAFARSTLEYMNHGLAVIASNSGGNVEQVVDGMTGFLYKVNNPTDLADKIIRLYDDENLLNTFKIKGRARFIECFTQEKYRENISRVIINCLYPNRYE